MNWPDDYINKIICGDCLEVMKGIPDRANLSLITDPIWPNAINLFDVDDPWDLLSRSLQEAKRCSIRFVIHLGLDSDPRFLSAVPIEFPYVRQFALRYARPHYKGRILYDRDIAYLFGDPPISRLGNRVLPGDIITSDSSGKLPGHPCARKLDHVRYLVDKCTEPNAVILDPFAGSGTTCVAAKQLGRKYVGIEINPDYCKIAEDRLRQEELF